MFNFTLSTKTADNFVPLGAKTPLGTVLTKFRPCVYMHNHHFRGNSNVMKSDFL